jgi:iron-sulfur cluster assembly accessory protein
MTEQLPITLDPSAADKVAEFKTAESVDTASALRLGVRGGGCSGYQYQLALDQVRDDDLVFVTAGQTIVVDRAMYPLVAGSRIVYRQELMSAGFDVENPQATSACGCGSSFRVDDEAGCSETVAEEPSVEESAYYL